MDDPKMWMVAIVTKMRNCHISAMVRPSTSKSVMLMLIHPLNPMQTFKILKF